METAGRAVVFSGITVAIGLLALVALPLPFLRSMGYGGMLIPLVSTLVAITLLPVVLAKLGPRLDWPHRRTDDKASRAWTRWAEARRAPPLGRRAAPAWRSSLALVVAATDLQLGTVRRRHDRQVGRRQGRASSRSSDSGIGEGALLPHEILVERRDRPGAGRRRAAPASTGIHGAVAPDDRRLAARRDRARRGDPDPRQRRPRRAATRSTRVRDAAHAAGPDVRVGGQPAAERRLHRRRLRQLPADDRADRDHHVHPAGAGVPLAAAAGEGDRAERPQRRRRLGRARARLAARLRLGGDLGHRRRPARSRRGCR